MKAVLFFLGLFCSPVGLSIAGAEELPELKTVSYVDPLQYVGRWYQISRNPLAFEPSDCVCAQQTLGLKQDGTVSVYNSCNEETPNGKMREIRGFAINEDPKTNSKFTVDFGLPHKGRYWIIGLAEDYSWAVVSDPSRLSLYVLSKTPEMAESSYQTAVAQASLQIDTSKLKSTAHAGCVYPETRE